MAVVELPQVQALLQGIIPDLIIETWIRLAAGHVDEGTYSNYLSFSHMFPFGGNAMAMAVANTAPHARVLEEGHAGFHLPEKIDWAAAEARGTAKRTKNGRRYIMVPFKHFSPGSTAVGSGRRRAMMPPDVYRVALAMTKDQEGRKAAQAFFAKRGPKLSRAYSLPAFPTALKERAQTQEGQPGYTWRAGKFEGLRAKTQVNPDTGRSSSTYATFRAVTEDSVGWYIPAQPGFHFAEETADAVRGPIREIVAIAARQDVVDLVNAKVHG